MVWVRLVELLINLLHRAVEYDGGRCVAGDRLDSPGEVDHSVLWVRGGQIGGRDLNGGKTSILESTTCSYLV